MPGSTRERSPSLPEQPPSPLAQLTVQSWANPDAWAVDNDDDGNGKRCEFVNLIAREVLRNLVQVQGHAIAMTCHPRVRRGPHLHLNGVVKVCEPDFVIGYPRSLVSNVVEPASIAAIQECRRPPAGNTDLIQAFMDACHVNGLVLRLSYHGGEDIRVDLIAAAGPLNALIPPLPAHAHRWLARRLADQLGHMTAGGLRATSVRVGNMHLQLASVRPGRLEYSRSFGLQDDGAPIPGRGTPNSLAVLLGHAFMHEANLQPA